MTTPPRSLGSCRTYPRELPSPPADPAPATSRTSSPTPPRAQEQSGASPGCDPDRGAAGLDASQVRPAYHWGKSQSRSRLTSHGGARASPQERTFPTAKKRVAQKRKVWKSQLQVCLSSLISSSSRAAVAKAGGGCPPLATHPLFIKPQRLKRKITLNTEAGSWRQLLVIDSTKYETACTSSMKHGISSILLVGEMNGA